MQHGISAKVQTIFHLFNFNAEQSDLMRLEKHLQVSIKMRHLLLLLYMTVIFFSFANICDRFYFCLFVYVTAALFR